MRIDALRRRFGLPAYAWSSAATGMHVLALHVTELRSAVTDVYAAGTLLRRYRPGPMQAWARASR
jgi:hypothetical protein